LNNILFLEDESIVVIGEEFRSLPSRDSDYFGASSSSSSRYYDDLLVLKFSSEGKLLWSNKLGRRESTSYSVGTNSFKYIQVNDAHYFCFIDNISDLKLSTKTEPSLDESNFLMAYKIQNQTGAVSKVSILDLENIKLNKSDKKPLSLGKFTISNMIEVSNKEFVFETYIKKKRDVLIKISLD
jgi:hypothetical protein